MRGCTFVRFWRVDNLSPNQSSTTALPVDCFEVVLHNVKLFVLLAMKAGVASQAMHGQEHRLDEPYRPHSLTRQWSTTACLVTSTLW
jgi:hypothetical protein